MRLHAQLAVLNITSVRHHHSLDMCSWRLRKSCIQRLLRLNISKDKRVKNFVRYTINFERTWWVAAKSGESSTPTGSNCKQQINNVKGKHGVFFVCLTVCSLTTETLRGFASDGPATGVEPALRLPRPLLRPRDWPRPRVGVVIC